MKNKFLDKNLIIEGLLQIRLPGIILLVVSALFSGLFAVYRYLTYIACNKSADINDFSLVKELQTIRISSLCPLLFPIMYLAPFVLCLALFSFLNNRKGSDFYHSLSAKRICIYLSFTVSILIWIIGIVLLSVLTASILYFAFGMILNPIFIPYVIFTYLAGAVLVMACMLFAMGITGTFLTNIILFGIILFLPRFIMTVALRCLHSLCPILGDNAGGIIDIQYNIPVNLIYKFLTNYDQGQSGFTFLPAILYSFILALIYFAIAGILFQKRKSEMAGSSAPNHILQHIYRCIVTLPIALLIPTIILVRGNISSDGFSLIVITLISLLIYFLYELITTKSAKKMLKSAPVFLVVVGICILYGVSVNFAKMNAINFTPTASDIESVYLALSNTNYSSSFPSYSKLMQKNLSIQKDSVKKIISDVLSNNVDEFKSGKELPTDNTISVGIKLKSGKYAERKLFLSKTQYKNFISAILSDNNYLKSVTQIPDDKSMDALSNEYIHDETKVKKLWEAFKSEYNSLPDSDKASIANGDSRLDSGGKSTSAISSFYIRGTYGIDYYCDNYLITSKTPKTYSMFMDCVNGINKDKMQSIFSSSKVEQINFINISYITGSDSDEKLVFYSKGENDDTTAYKNIKKCFDILCKEFNNPVDAAKPHAVILIITDHGRRQYVYFQPLSKENATAIEDLKLISSK